jgi:hypothetical protein
MDGLMRRLWLPILLVLTGCSITVPWSLPIRYPAPTGEAVSPAKFASEKRSVRIRCSSTRRRLARPT